MRGPCHNMARSEQLVGKLSSHTVKHAQAYADLEKCQHIA